MEAILRSSTKGISIDSLEDGGERELTRSRKLEKSEGPLPLPTVSELGLSGTLFPSLSGDAVVLSVSNELAGLHSSSSGLVVGYSGGDLDRCGDEDWGDMAGEGTGEMPGEAPGEAKGESFRR